MSTREARLAQRIARLMRRCNYSDDKKVTAVVAIALAMIQIKTGGGNG